jgi:hypothetical protein
MACVEAMGSLLGDAKAALATGKCCDALVCLTLTTFLSVGHLVVANASLCC